MTAENLDAYYPALYLSNDQIVDLLKIAFPIAFYQLPLTEKCNLDLPIRKSDTESGFDFWFICSYIHEGTKETRNFRGTVFGEDECFICKGCDKWTEDCLFDDWQNDFVIPVRKVYQYLESIFLNIASPLGFMLRN